LAENALLFFTRSGNSKTLRRLGQSCCLVLDNFEKNYGAASVAAAAALSDLVKVGGELVFFDDEKVL
jgi:hypothetical protein